MKCHLHFPWFILIDDKRQRHTLLQAHVSYSPNHSWAPYPRTVERFAHTVFSVGILITKIKFWFQFRRGYMFYRLSFGFHWRSSSSSFPRHWLSSWWSYKVRLCSLPTTISTKFLCCLLVSREFQANCNCFLSFECEFHLRKDMQVLKGRRSCIWMNF